MVYIAIVKQEIAHGGWLRYKQGLYVLVKEVVVLKEFKHLRRIGCSCRPVGLLL
jgi:hypothetical protein